MLDLILLLLIATTIFMGWRKGGLVACMNLISSILSIFLVYISRNTLANIVLSTPMKGYIESHLPEKLQQTKEFSLLGTWATNTGEGITHTIAMIVGMVIAFILLRVLFYIIIRVLNRVLHILSLGSLNRMFGACLAIVPAYISVYIVTLIISGMAPVADWAMWLKNGSVIMRLIPSPFAIFAMF